jgi:hypothetical protein
VFLSSPEFFLDLGLSSSRWMMLNMIGTMRIACWQFSRSSSQSSSSTATQGPEVALCSTLNRKPDQLANSRAMDLRIQIYSSFLLFFFSILHFIHSYLPSFPPSLFFAGGAFSFSVGLVGKGVFIAPPHDLSPHNEEIYHVFKCCSLQFFSMFRPCVMETRLTDS